MAILETLITIFFILFVVGLVLSLAIWLTWLWFILAVVFLVLRFVAWLGRKVKSPQ